MGSSFSGANVRSSSCGPSGGESEGQRKYGKYLGSLIRMVTVTLRLRNPALVADVPPPPSTLRSLLCRGEETRVH